MNSILLKGICFFLLLNGALACQTENWDTKDDKEKRKIKTQINAVKFKFDQELLTALEQSQFDLNQFVIKTFIPQFKHTLETQFEDKKQDRKKLSDLPFYATLTRYFPDSLLSPVRYVVVNQFPTMGELFSKAGINRAQLSLFNIKIDDKIWRFRPGALTIGDLIYIDKDELSDISTFFHECVHVAQYKQLGVEKFLMMYANALLAGFAYEDIPFEMTAYYLQKKFESKSVFSTVEFIRNII